MLTRLLLKISFGFAIILSIFTVGAILNQAEAAAFRINPSTKSFEIGCTREVEIVIDATGQNANAADIEILYNPDDVEVLQVNPGNAFQSYIPATINPSAGKIKLAGFSFSGGTLSSRKTFGTIVFEGKAGSNNFNFDIRFDGIGATLDSNIADAITSSDLLTEVTDGTFSLFSGICESDTRAPDITFQDPINNQRGFPSDGNLKVRITDNSSGVNLAQVEFILNGTTYKPGSAGVTQTGSSLSYSFTIDPNTDLPSNALSTFVVKAYDYSGNFAQRQIIFNNPDADPSGNNDGGGGGNNDGGNDGGNDGNNTGGNNNSGGGTPTPTPVPGAPDTNNINIDINDNGSGPTPGDTTQPIVLFISPQPFEVNVPSDAEIRINITDELSPINKASVIIFINGREYRLDSPEVKVQQNSFQDIIVTIKPRVPLNTTTYNIVRVVGSDTANNRFDAEMIFNIPAGLINLERCETLISSKISSQPIAGLYQCTSAIESSFASLANSSLASGPFKAFGVAGLFSLIGLLAILLYLLPFFTKPPLLIVLFKKILGIGGIGQAVGVVTDMATKKPIPFAICQLTPGDRNVKQQWALSDAQGRFYFDWVPGDYKFRVSKLGFNAVSKDLSLPEDLAAIDFDTELAPMYLTNTTNESFSTKLKYYGSRFYYIIIKAIFALGVILSLVSVLNGGGVLAYVVFGFYAIMVLFTIYKSFRLKQTSSMVNVATNYGVTYTIVRLYDAKTGRLYNTYISDNAGKFSVADADAGGYNIQLNSRTYSFSAESSESKPVASKYGQIMAITLAQKPGTLNLMLQAAPNYVATGGAKGGVAAPGVGGTAKPATATASPIASTTAIPAAQPATSTTTTPGTAPVPGK